jgi:hypothetical protein
MPQFMDIHSGMQGITEEQLRAEHDRDLACEQGTDVHFQKAWADPKSGKVFCLSEGPDAETVKKVHADAGHLADDLYEVPYSV